MLIVLTKFGALYLAESCNSNFHWMTLVNCTRFTKSGLNWQKKLFYSSVKIGMKYISKQKEIEINPEIATYDRLLEMVKA